MQNVEPLDYLPLWGSFFATIALTFLAVEFGYRLGNYRRRVSETEKESTLGPIVGATLGLLAFLLAFTFGLAASRYDARRQMVVKEANAIGTTYLRAGLLGEPYPEKIRDLLRKYVDVRLEAVRTGDVERGVAESTALHAQLWDRAESLAAEDRNSEISATFIVSLNEMIDLHAERVLIGVRSRIPVVIWLTLYLVTFLTMLQLGYYKGVSGSRRSSAVAALVLTFSIVMLLIADLDRPHEGLIRVSQQALLELRDSMPSPTATGAGR